MREVSQQALEELLAMPVEERDSPPELLAKNFLSWRELRKPLGSSAAMP